MSDPFRKRAEPDRYTGMVRSMRTRERKHMRHRWQWVALGVALLMLGVSGFAFWVYRSTVGKIQKPVPNVSPVEREGDPFVALLVGSDSRAGLTEEEQLRLGAGDEGVFGERADTLIMAHVDPATDKVMMVQFPRDLLVSIPGRGRDRVNSALLEGKRRLVATIERLTGLSINHYAQVNIAGFRDLIDAIGGVEVCIPEAIEFDEQTGLEVKEPGMIHFSGERALRFVRSRKVFAEGDLDRIQNQQKFLAAAIDKVTSVGTLINPLRIRRLIETAGDNLSIDQGTSVTDLYRIGQRLREFDPDTYEAYTVPHLGPALVQEKSVVLPDERAMAVMFQAIERNESPAEADGVPSIEASAIRVGVYNGTSEDYAARTAAERLRTATDGAGGPVTIAPDDIANAGSFGYRRTVVRYSADRPEAERMAELVSAALPGAKVVEGETEDDVDVAVIVGRRFRTKPLVQVLPIPIPKPGALPEVCRG